MNTISIGDLRNVLSNGTKIVCIYDLLDAKEEKIISNDIFTVKNILFGNSAFADIKVGDVRTEHNEVWINLTYAMPYEVFMAWKDYATRHFMSL